MYRQMGGAPERLSRLERRCQGLNREMQVLNKRQEKIPDAIDGRLRVQDRASERLQDQPIEEMKELENTKTERSLAVSGKGT